jgi:hypothetical protein
MDADDEMASVEHEARAYLASLGDKGAAGAVTLESFGEVEDAIEVLETESRT